MVSNREKAECAEREVRRRKQVYPGYIERGRMTVNKARHEMEVITAIAEDYRQLAERDEPRLLTDEGLVP